MKIFLFGPYSLSFQTIDWLFFIDAAGAFLLGIVLVFILRFSKINPVRYKLINKFKNLGFAYGSAGLFWSWLRYENALYLSWRFWMILFALGATVWFIKIILYWRKEYQEELSEWHERRRKQKYIKS